MSILYVFILLGLLAFIIHLLEWLLKPSLNQNEAHSPDYRLIALRQQNGFTQKEAARYLKTSWYAIYDYEEGRKYPVPESWYRILEARLTSF
jgi:DNA-binding XRE family transcriptional regulator